MMVFHCPFLQIPCHCNPASQKYWLWFTQPSISMFLYSADGVLPALYIKGSNRAYSHPFGFLLQHYRRCAVQNVFCLARPLLGSSAQQPLHPCWSCFDEREKQQSWILSPCTNSCHFLNQDVAIGISVFPQQEKHRNRCVLIFSGKVMVTTYEYVRSFSFHWKAIGTQTGTVSNAVFSWACSSPLSFQITLQNLVSDLAWKLFCSKNQYHQITTGPESPLYPVLVSLSTHLRETWGN